MARPFSLLEKAVLERKCVPVKPSREAVEQNLKDAGCGLETIHRFWEYFQQGCVEEQLQLLSWQRGRLLEELHAQQKQIDCLDYLVYQLEKGLAATKEAPQEKPRRSVRREYH